MVLDALEASQGVVPDVDTGTTRADLLGLLREAVERMQAFGVDAVRGLMSEASTDLAAAAAALTGRLIGPALSQMYRRAAERGEIGSTVLPERILTLPAQSTSTQSEAPFTHATAI